MCSVDMSTAAVQHLLGLFAPPSCVGILLNFVTHTDQVVPSKMLTVAPARARCAPGSVTDIEVTYLVDAPGAWAATLELEVRGGKLGLATMCVGVGQGVSLALERV